MFFLIVVIGCMKGREEMKEKEVKEERGRDGVFNLLSSARGGKKGEEVPPMQAGKRRTFRKKVKDKQ